MWVAILAFALIIGAIVLIGRLLPADPQFPACYQIIDRIISNGGWQALDYFERTGWDEDALRRFDFEAWSELQIYGLLPPNAATRQAIHDALNMTAGDR
jgi:hypothetical protein